MARDPASITAVGALLALALTFTFWPTGAFAKNDKIDDRDEICNAYKRTALWGQCTRAVVNGCHESEASHRRCGQWAERWRDQTGGEPPWLLLCGGSASKCVFVTSGTFTGNLVAEATTLTGQTPSDGLDAGDRICQFLADGSGSLAAPGTYRAWLSTVSGSPSTRFTRSTAPYELVDGTLVANSYDDLTDGSLASPISLTELDAIVSSPNVFVWTGTWISGVFIEDIVGPTSGPSTCGGWTSGNNALVGFFGGALHGAWTAFNATFCNQTLHLYCFQQ